VNECCSIDAEGKKMTRKLALISMDKDLLDTIVSEERDTCIGYTDIVPVPGLALPHLGYDEDAPRIVGEFPGCQFVMAMDKPAMKNTLCNKYPKDGFSGYVSTGAYVSQNSDINDTVVIQKSAYISHSVTISEFAKINVGAQVHHDVAIKPFVTVAPGALIMGNVQVGRGSYIGAGAVIHQNIIIGENAVIGAGAVVIDDIANGTTAMGVPARS
jgi:sugar O-acyltransferase (sialic acid O-acetyltransferase NeuD family)